MKSTDYLGLDVREQVKMTVIPAAQLPEYKAHPDDLNLDDEPTLFEQVMSGNADTDSDTDDTSRDGDVTNCDADVGDSRMMPPTHRSRTASAESTHPTEETKQGPDMCGLNSRRTEDSTPDPTEGQAA